MNLRGRNKVSAEFNMSLTVVFLYLMDINHGDLLTCGARKTDSNIAVSINKELQFFIDKEPVSETELESKLLAMLAKIKN
jgi:biopolymer transport protein ExbD